MRTAEKDPTFIEDIGALADLYVGVFRLMGRRLSARTHKGRAYEQTFRVSPDDLLPPPMPDWREHRQPTHLARRNWERRETADGAQRREVRLR